MPNTKKTYKETRKKRFNLLLSIQEMNFLKEISHLENKPIAEILRNAVEYLYTHNSKEKIFDSLDILKNKTYWDHKTLQKLEEDKIYEFRND
ncbi:MAG: hypothetical protein ACK4UJ_08370 [Leptonema sp. (in: bacteria)]